MKREDILNLEDMEVTQEQFEEIEESELVVSVENCGGSGRFVGLNWYVVTMNDGTEVNIYG